MSLVFGDIPFKCCIVFLNFGENRRDSQLISECLVINRFVAVFCILIFFDGSVFNKLFS